MKIVYERGQVLGKHGIKYLEEIQGIPRINPKGIRYIERYALFLCGDCPNEFRAHIGKVKCGWTKSCGCRKFTSDGISYLPSGERDPIHILWKGMIERCHDPKSVGFKNYGARGISVCTEWRDSFKAFRDWAVNNGYAKGLQIDRRENNGSYKPENCRFITNFENQSNRRNNKHCWINGEKVIWAEAARRLSVSSITIRAWSKQPIEAKKFRKRPFGLTFEDPN